jgi:subtilisin family serine protease
MHKRKLGWWSVFISGLGVLMLSAFSATAQTKGTFIPWERPENWNTFEPNVDYASNTFVVGFSKPTLDPARLNAILNAIRSVGNSQKLQITDVSEDFFGKDMRSQVPKVQALVPSTSRANLANPNVCGNLVRYFRVSDASGDQLANLINALNTEIGLNFPDDVFVVEPDPTGRPIQAVFGADWAKAAISSAHQPVSASNVTVAVLDTGYNALPGYAPTRAWNAVFKLPNGSSNSKFTSTQLVDAADNLNTPDTRGHGTGVASIIRGPKTVSGRLNTISLTSDAEIYPIKVCEDETCSGVSIALGICRAISDTQPVNIINLSVAGLAPSGLVKGAVEDALAANVTVVAAAGNIKTDKVRPDQWNETPGQYHFDVKLYPAAFSSAEDGLISVGAAEQANGGYTWAVFNPKAPRWSIATAQPRTVTNLHETIDLMAPGKYVLALPNDDRASWTNVVGGTSFSAPFVSAAAAIVLSQHPTLTPANLEKVLRDAASAHPVDCPPGMCGTGMLNVQGALDLLDNSAYRPTVGLTP